MNLKRYDDSLMEIILSFQPWIQHLKQSAKSQSGSASEQARQLLSKMVPYSELGVGTDESSCLMQHKVLLAELRS